MDDAELLKATLCEMRTMNETLKNMACVLSMINNKLDKVHETVKSTKYTGKEIGYR